MSNIKNQVAIINLGTELTQGFTQNTNAHWISGRLRDMGFDTAYQIALPDSADTWNSTWNMIREAGVRMVIIGGGLGPTADDKTRDLIAKTLNRPLVYHPEWEEPIKLWFTSRGKPYSASNQIQACFPEGALVLDNPVGTAPGFQVTHEGITLFATPGVPSEAKAMFERHIAPWLLAQGAPNFFTKETGLAEITESDLELVLRKVDFTEDVSWS
ncbi:MAG: competence/damage-inducible protein A, partial [Fibrobacteraceae bacterium]